MFLASILMAATLAGQPAPPVELELIDQHGVADSLAAHRGRVTLVMVVTVRRLRNLKAWETEILERREGIDFLRVADVPEDPPVTREQVARKLSWRVPDRISILIDVRRRWATEMQLDTARPNLLLFDREGRLAATFRGRMEEELLEELLAAIDRLAEER